MCQCSSGYDHGYRATGVGPRTMVLSFGVLKIGQYRVKGCEVLHSETMAETVGWYLRWGNQNIPLGFSGGACKLTGRA